MIESTTSTSEGTCDKSLSSSQSYEGFFQFIDNAHSLGYAVDDDNDDRKACHGKDRTLLFARPAYSVSMLNDALFYECYRQFHRRRRRAQRLSAVGVKIVL